jgi:hypothetical protein
MLCYRVFQGWNNSGHVIQSPEAVAKYHNAIEGMYDHRRFQVTDQIPTRKLTRKEGRKEGNDDGQQATQCDRLW